ncbi:HNH endonuclease [Simplicispira lacusdiani]|uniref:HNH endonuclease n=1 Tax=Simplicispira lacusdiani TaxID=2213010 RepID=UPI000E73A60D|nr:HNH endonuclease [Simplicispira lacusdiani]
MSTKPLDRLLFAQGGDCFFCRQPLPREQASIEHLVATTHGGKDNDENLVACCQALNTLFGRMSLKEKLAVILRQKGAFQCPARLAPATASAAPPPAPQPAAPACAATPLQAVLAGLRKRGNARPRTLDALAALVADLLEQNGFAAREAKDVLARLRGQHYIEVQDRRITAYLLPPRQG